jgi:hypothetical protein
VRLFARLSIRYERARPRSSWQALKCASVPAPSAARLSDERFERPSTMVVGDTAILVALVVDEVERDGKQQIHRLRLTQT